MAALTPFPVDPEIRRRIRPMTAADAPEVARLHEAAMGASVWAQLGRGFLTAVYRAALPHPDFLGYVYDESGHIGGFIAGSSNPERLTRETLQRFGLRVAWAASARLLRHPALLPRLAGTLRYFRDSRPPDVPENCAESFFCSFEPQLRGKRISGLINKVLFDELARRGRRWVKITTDAHNADAARQLTSWGFAQAGTFRFYGKPMIVWLLDLRNCERVEKPAGAAR
jgi:hypothetical protein